MKILIAEQDRDFSSAFSSLLSMDGHDVTVVYDGTQVISKLGQGLDPDIAIVDESLPRISAEILLKPLSDRKIPAIVITSGRITASKLTKEPLPDAYIALPFLPSELTGLIGSVSEKKHSTVTIDIEDVSVSLPDFRLCGRIPVTDGEIEVLKLLCRCEQISGKRMGPYISALNIKLERLKKNYRIKYLINEGYRMVSIKDE